MPRLPLIWLLLSTILFLVSCIETTTSTVSNSSLGDDTNDKTLIGSDSSASNNNADISSSDENVVQSEYTLSDEGISYGYQASGYPVYLIDLFSYDTVKFIDLTNSSGCIGQQGTESCPYTSLSTAFTKSGSNYLLNSNTAYLFKRGSLISIEKNTLYGSGVSNVLLAAYGNTTLARPKVLASNGSGNNGAIIQLLNATSVIVRDFDLRDQAGYTSSYLMRFWNVTSGLVYNCHFDGGVWGFRLMGSRDIKFINNVIENTFDDNLFAQANDQVEVAYSTFMRANQDWIDSSTTEAEAGGDSLQFSQSFDLNIHHNYFNRGDKGNKFCVISRNERKCTNYNSDAQYCESYGHRIPYAQRLSLNIEAVSEADYYSNYNNYRIKLSLLNNYCVKPRADGKGGAGFYFQEFFQGQVKFNKIVNSPEYGGLSNIYFGANSKDSDHFVVEDNYFE